jgi:hypothetical protein
MVLVMILAQSAIAGGAVLLLFFGIFLLIGIPILTGAFMKFIWKRMNKVEYIKNNMPYYKDPLWYFPCLILSIILLGFIFYGLLILYDRLYPQLINFN